MKFCRKCGAALPDDACFCGKCGEKTSASDIGNRQKASFCRKCGSEISPGAVFCRKCGCSLSRTTAASLLIENVVCRTNSETEKITFCRKCGNKISEGTAFCRKCGASMSTAKTPDNDGQRSVSSRPLSDTVEPATQKNTQKGLLVAAAAVFVLLASVIAAYFIFFKTFTFDFSKYIDVKFDGYDGTGTYSYTFLQDQFEKDCFGKIKYRSGSIGDAVSLQGFKNTLAASIQIDKQPEEPLSNGDVITFTLSNGALLEKEFRVTLKSVQKHVTVRGLTMLQSVDPFQYITYEFSGYDGSGRINFTPAKNAPEWFSDIMISCEQDRKIKNGDTVTITAAEKPDSKGTLAAKWGIKLEKTSITAQCASNVLSPDTRSNVYILENSSHLRLNSYEYKNLTPNQLQRAIDEIYARHGKIFEDPKTQQYFDDQKWYEPNESFDASALNETEISNIQILKSYIKQVDTYGISPDDYWFNSTTYFVVPSAGLMLRKGPSTEYKKITTLPKNTVFTATAANEKGDWYYGNYGRLSKAETTGWVRAEYLTTRPPMTGVWTADGYTYTFNADGRGKYKVKNGQEYSFSYTVDEYDDINISYDGYGSHSLSYYFEGGTLILNGTTYKKVS